MSMTVTAPDGGLHNMDEVTVIYEKHLLAPITTYEGHVPSSQLLHLLLLL